MPPKLFNKITPFKNGNGKITVSFNQDAKEEPVTILIYEDIGDDPWSMSGFSASDFADALSNIPKNRPIDVRVNTAGGMVWDGMAIKTLFDEWPSRKTASIDGMAASVGSWFMLGADEIRARSHAQMFVHPAWGVVAGYAKNARDMADDLDKSTNQIADIYAAKSGKSRADWLALMDAETLMTAEEARDLGLIDKIVDEKPVSNFTDKQVANMKNRLAIMRNSLSAPPGGAKNQQTKEQDMDKTKMIALLNKWGVKVPENANEEQLEALIAAGKPKAKNVIKFANGIDGDHDGDCDCDDCAKVAKNKADGQLASLLNRLEIAEKRAAKEMSKAVENRVKALVESNRLQAKEFQPTLDLALKSADADSFLNILEAQEPRRIGIDPIPAEVGEPESPADLNAAVENLMKPQRHLSSNRTQPDLQDRLIIGANSKKVSQLINRLKKFDDRNQLTGPLIDMWNAWAASSGSSPRNANTMSADLLRQVILSEIMRAFKRQFTSLGFFAHTYQGVPLEGTDYVKVPYYPLDTGASSEFTYSAGYVVTPGAVTNSKSILVGGIGNGVATAGSGRKYKPLQFTAYEIRRQPWLSISQLTVMAGEQLAIDVRADIIGANIKAANFGNAIWTGASGGFDHTVVTQYLQNAAIKAFWPATGRNVVLAPDYYTALAADPGITPYLSLGTTELLRQGVIGGLYGFENIMPDALIPVANFIRGGDGTVTAGGDTNLCGYMAYPSALLIATAPIMPPPGVLKKLVSYEQVTDDQTGLSITYQYFGEEKVNADSEIIECTYGSGLGELAALKRLTSAGN